MLLQKIQASVATLAAVNRLIAAVLFTTLTAVVALQVFSRFVIHAPRVNMALVYAAIPTFAALSAIYAAANLLVDYAAFRQGRGPASRPPAAAD